MRPPAAALANAGPRPHTLLVSHFVEVAPEYIETKHGQVSHFVEVRPEYIETKHGQVSHFVEVRPEYRTRTWASQSPSSLSISS